MSIVSTSCLPVERKDQHAHEDHDDTDNFP
jgi:hypothetical protein